MSLKHSVLVLTCVLHCASRSDPDHYKNVLIGERAAGLGGAFVALSDDPSGIYYNPAGLGFHKKDYLSTSSNSLSVANATFKDVFPGFDYKTTSSSFVPSFFGFTQSLGAYNGGFAVVVPNYDLYDQQDELKNYNSDTTDTTLTNYNFRRFFRQDITYMLGAALARDYTPQISVGVSLFLQYRTLKSIDNQTVAFNPLPSGRYFHRNIYVDGKTIALVPKLGIQYISSPKLTYGFAIQLPTQVTSSADIKTDKSTQSDPDDPSSDYVEQSGVFSSDWSEAKVRESLATIKHFSATSGLAYLVNSKWLLTGDLDLYFPALRTSEKFFFNLSLGSEYFIKDRLPIRVGIFTNRSATGVNASEFAGLNLLGGSLSVAFLKKSSSFSLGSSYLYGKGLGNIVGAQNLKTIIYSQLNVFISGSYQL